MKRTIVALLCLLTLAVLPACSSGDDDDDNGDGGSGGGGITLTGNWNGGGTYTEVNNGSSTNQNFTLALNLVENAGTVSGSFTYVRTSVGLRKSGSVSGSTSGGAVNIAFSDRSLSMTGSYSGDSMSVTVTESFTSGPVAWIRGRGTLNR